MSRPRKSRVLEKPHYLLATNEYIECGKWFIDCLCDCGKSHKVKSENFRTTKSCGCLRQELCENLNRKHGLSYSKEYAAWDSMKDRCLKVTHPAYNNYGGRGISVCQDWIESFENFFEDMGEAPEGTSLDRVDVNGNYSKENCRWASYKIQNNNKRNNIIVIIDFESRTLSEWCSYFNISIQCVQYRVNKLGMSYEVALKTPKMRDRK